MTRFIGTIYAERSLAHPDKVRLYLRYWDGVDRPSYTDIQYLNSDQARDLGQQLLAAAERIDGKSKKDRTAARIKTAVQKIIDQAKKDADL